MFWSRWSPTLSYHLVSLHLPEKTSSTMALMRLVAHPLLSGDTFAQNTMSFLHSIMVFLCGILHLLSPSQLTLCSDIYLALTLSLLRKTSILWLFSNMAEIGLQCLALLTYHSCTAVYIFSLHSSLLCTAATLNILLNFICSTPSRMQVLKDPEWLLFSSHCAGYTGLQQNCRPGHAQILVSLVPLSYANYCVCV